LVVKCALVAIALQILAGGFAAGAVYGLVAVGHSLVFRLTGVVHFAFGELIALGVFVTLFVAAGSGPVSQTSVGGGRFVLALVVGLVVTAAASVGAYFLAIEPYRARGSVIGWVGASLAVAFTIRTLLVVFFDRPAYVFPDPIPFHEAGSNGIVTVAGASFQVRSLFVIALGAALAWGVTVTIRSTRFGRGLQAVSEDVTGANVVGVPVDTYVSLAFGLVAAVAVVIAVVAAPSGPFTITTGTILGVKGLIVAVLVGFSTPWAAFAAGLGYGVIEAAIASGTLLGHDLGPAYREVLPFTAVLIVLALRERARRPGVETEPG
jgi:branched-chain amino acid transport system permease protein